MTEFVNSRTLKNLIQFITFRSHFLPTFTSLNSITSLYALVVLSLIWSLTCRPKRESCFKLHNRHSWRRFHFLTITLISISCLINPDKIVLTDRHGCISRLDAFSSLGILCHFLQTHNKTNPACCFHRTLLCTKDPKRSKKKKKKKRKET